MMILSRLLTIKEALDERGKIYWLIAIAFTMVILLEYLIPLYGDDFVGRFLIESESSFGSHFRSYGINIVEFVCPRSAGTVANWLVKQPQPPQSSSDIENLNLFDPTL